MSAQTLRALRHALAAAPFALAACGGGSDGPTTQPGPTVASVAVTLAAPTVDAGATTQATATPRDASGAALAGRAAAWSSSATAIATVDAASGLVTARAPGTAQISATVDGRSGSAALTVRAVAGVTTVTMLPVSFVPPFIEVKRGATVAWDFTGGIDHNVIFAARTGVPADIPIRRSGTVTRQFNTVGTFPYQCTLHAGMIGEVAVVP